MTRKDYELIAKTLKEAKHHSLHPTVVDDVVTRFADALEAENPRFDRQRFTAACQP